MNLDEMLEHLETLGNDTCFYDLSVVIYLADIIGYQYDGVYFNKIKK